MHNVINVVSSGCIFIIIFLLCLSDISYAQDYGVPDSIIVGNLDGASIQANPGDMINIPMWLKNDEDIGAVSLLIAAPDQFIAQWTECAEFGQLATWPSIWDYDGQVEDEPYLGYSTQRITGVYVHLADPNLDGTPINTNGVWTKIAEYTCIISGDEANIRDSTQIIEGAYSDFGTLYFNDLTGDLHWTPVYIGGYLKVMHPDYEYLIGDANMYTGGWWPTVTGGDVTYLTNFFRGLPSSVPCLLDNFWASADANGDCLVLGSDVTRIMNYLRGTATLSWCPDYPALWHSPMDVILYPPPPGWPNCE